MACSCKKKNITQQQVQKQAQKIVLPIIKQQEQYTFTATTKPLDSCAFCAAKHIALALVLLNKNTQMDTLIALGQLMAAKYHYNTQEQVQTKLLDYTIDLLFNNKFQVTTQIVQSLRSLAQQAQYIRQIPQSIQEVPSSVQYSPKEALKHACLAYSLLFTQLFYQTINKPYAIGELVLAALHLQEQDRQRAKHLRQIWKVVQQIKKPNDRDYLVSRQLLRDFMLDLKKALIIIV